jgi:HEAT repeat protein
MRYANLFVLVLLAAPLAHAAPDSFVLEVAEAAALARQENPELAARVYSLRGLDPRFYRRQRRPEPEVGRELVRLAAPPALLIERYLTSGNDKLSPAELVALREGIVVALGRAREPLVTVFLLQVIATGEPVTAAAAAASLGMVGGRDSVPALTALAHNTKSGEGARAGAIRGLGRTRSESAVAPLARLAQSGEPVVIRRGAVHALGQLGASGVLLEVLAGAPAELHDDIIEALCVVARPSTLSRLNALVLGGSPELRPVAARAAGRVQRVLSRPR